MVFKKLRGSFRRNKKQDTKDVHEPTKEVVSF